jgi:hypothetical protein
MAYMQGAELPDEAITWRDSTGAVIDFSSGWTFTLRVGKPGEDALIEKTTGITGASTAPNVTIAWDQGELEPLTPGVWAVDITATRTSDDKQRTMRLDLVVKLAVGEYTPTTPGTPGIIDGGTP